MQVVQPVRVVCTPPSTDMLPPLPRRPPDTEYYLTRPPLLTQLLETLLRPHPGPANCEQLVYGRRSGILSIRTRRSQHLT